MFEKLSDKELVGETLKGNKEAYRVLFERYQRRVYVLAYQTVRSKEDAEDVVQESFVKVYLSLRNFRGQSSFYTWLYRIVYNMAIDFKRKIARRGGVSIGLDEGQMELAVENFKSLPGSMAGPHDELLAREQRTRITKVMDELSEEHRSVIVLREIEGMSYEEMSKIVGVSKGTIMSRLHYARKQLQKALQDLAPEVRADKEDEVTSEDGDLMERSAGESSYSSCVK